ncbi:hypothetical protein [Streptomyces sp. NPDC088725]|uniref:hypothetical protein n=1 Tax=Streptomyces sp. NPDC088725 TaxID=3365873 RepID=UPI00380D8AD7
MKLRRAMAVAAATAVIAPAAFLAAPSAFADENSSNTVQTSPTEQPEPEDSATDAPEDSESPESEAPSESTAPEGGPSTPAESPSAPETDPATSPSPSPSDTPGKPTGSPSASPSTPSGEPSNYPDDCLADGEVKFDKNLQTSLSGLPDKVVAGSGFHSFKLNVSNKGKNDYKQVDLGVFAGQLDEDTWEETSGHLTLQYKDPTSGTWTAISLDMNDEGYGYLGFTSVKAKESFSIDMRLSVDKSAPAGLGYAFSLGLYADDKGNCVIADDDAYYEFDIIAAGQNAGTPNEAKPQGGHKPLTTKPVGNTEIKPEGRLAETGSSSMVPVIGLVGGIAVVVGAGAMFTVKRRRGGAVA